MSLILCRKGQSLIEYFLLFVVIAMFTVIGLGNTTLTQTVKSALEGFFNTGVQRVTNEVVAP